MATLYTHQDSNIAKTWVIMTTFFALVILLGWGVVKMWDGMLLY